MGNIFSSTDIRGHIGESLTTEYVWNVGKAFAEWLPEKGSVIIVKSETANHGTVHALIEGLMLQGRSVIDEGVGDQETVIGSILSNHASGAALIDYQDSQMLAVITLFDERGVVITNSTGLSEINRLVESGNFLPASEKGELRTD